MSWDEQEKELVIRIKNNSDLDAFKEVFNHYNAILVNYARNFVSDVEQAKDLTQETFISFWENRKKIKSPEALKSFLFKSLKNKCLNYLKHNTVKEKYRDKVVFEIKKIELQYSETLNKTFLDFQERELIQILDNILEQLPENRRKIFEMSRLEGMQNKEIADKLNISVRTVDTQIYRALKFIKENLKEKI